VIRGGTRTRASGRPARRPSGDRGHPDRATALTRSAARPSPAPRYGRAPRCSPGRR